jgi:hypothetical protein
LWLLVAVAVLEQVLVDMVAVAQEACYQALG